MKRRLRPRHPEEAAPASFNREAMKDFTAELIVSLGAVRHDRPLAVSASKSQGVSLEEAIKIANEQDLGRWDAPSS